MRECGRGSDAGYVINTLGGATVTHILTPRTTATTTTTITTTTAIATTTSGYRRSLNS